jgi:hypothetical protein
MVAPATAHAGRTFYGWLYGTEVMPERGAEIQTWVSEENDVGPENHARETSWWVGPAIGITDQLELVLPVQLTWEREGTKSSLASGTALDNYGVELRYRFVTQDPVDAPAFAPLVRIAVKRDVTHPDAVQPEADLVTSYQTGVFHGLVDLGTVVNVSSAKTHVEFRPGAGISIEVVESLRLGGEVVASLTPDSGYGNWVTVGPNMAWSHGRSWISASLGIGIKDIKDTGRLQWGIAF